MSERNILMIVGDYVEDYEAMVPFQALQMVGHNVDTVCPEKKEGSSVKTAIHDFRGDQTYMESRGHDFKITANIDEISLEKYDGLVIPGGRAPEYLRTYNSVIEIIQHFFEKNKPVASICHGIQILSAAGVIDGYRCTGYPAVKSEIEKSGGEWSDDTVVDGNLVTAQAWPDHPQWVAKFLDLLEETETEEIQAK